MRIPKSFKFAGMEFTVSIVDSLEDEDGYIYGDFDTNTCEIRIAKKCGDEPVCEQTMINTYYHELAHALQYFYENKLDESFAQSVGNLLMQYNQTVVYGKEK